MKKALVFALGMAFAVPALSQSFTPTRPVELVVHTGPGGGSDVLARAMAVMSVPRPSVPRPVARNVKS